MNADPTNTCDRHLGLAEFIAGAADESIDDQANTHLSRCRHCQREAKRWNVTAQAVRGLQANVLPTVQPAWPPLRTANRFSAPWSSAIRTAAAVAAALALLFGIGLATGTVHVHLSDHHSQTALTAVSGCSQLQQADGTLKQVHDTSLVIQTPGGRLATVTTTASTFVSMSGALLNDIIDGTSVIVRGHTHDGTIQAAFITIGQPSNAINPAGFTLFQGTVSDASSSGFTLDTATGSELSITTSPSTLVIVPHASTSQLMTGTSIFAIGLPAQDGTLSAKAIAAVSQLPRGRHISVSTKGCSSGDIIEALGTISASTASAD